MHPNVKALLQRPRTPAQTKAWFLVRQGSLSATDFNSILGCNPYRSRKKLLQEKVWGKDQEVKSAAIAHGLKYEEEALKVYSEKTGRILVGEPIGYVLSETTPYVGCTPDAVCRDEAILVEVKCPFYREFEAKVPEIYWPQLQVQMYVTQIYEADFVQYQPQTLTKPQKMEIVRVQFDPEWWAFAKALAAKE